VSAVRDAKIEGFDIKEGDKLCLLDDRIVAVADTLGEGARGLTEIMLYSGEFFSIYYGEGVTEEEAKELADFASSKFPDAEIEVFNGGQPIYDYVLSVI
jgi:dihydroxyacetone kinase-like predicted kinase